MSHALRVGVADQIGLFRAYNTDGSAKTDLTSATAGLAISVFRVGASSVSIASLSNKAGDDTTHADGAIRAIGGNLYSVDLPDAACASQVPSITVRGSYTGGVIEGLSHPLVGYDASAVAVGANTAAPDNAGIAAIKGSTDNLPSDPADQSLIIAATDALLTAVNSRLAEASYTAPDNATIASILAIVQLTDADVSTMPTDVRDAILNRLLAGNHDISGSVGRLLQLLLRIPDAAPGGSGGLPVLSAGLTVSAELDSAARVKLDANQPDYDVAKSSDHRIYKGVVLAGNTGWVTVDDPPAQLSTAAYLDDCLMRITYANGRQQLRWIRAHFISTGDAGFNPDADFTAAPQAGDTIEIFATARWTSRLTYWRANAPGNLDGNGFVPSNVGAVNGNTTRAATFASWLDNNLLQVVLTKTRKFFQLVLRKDPAIATDNVTELNELNADGGSGTGAFTNVTDSLEAIRDRGDIAWISGGGGGGGGGQATLMLSTTISTVTSQTVLILTDGTGETDAYKDMLVIVTDQATATQKSRAMVASYAGGTKTLTLSSACTFEVAVGDLVEIVAVSGRTTEFTGSALTKLNQIQSSVVMQEGATAYSPVRPGGKIILTAGDDYADDIDTTFMLPFDDPDLVIYDRMTHASTASIKLGAARGLPSGQSVDQKRDMIVGTIQKAAVTEHDGVTYIPIQIPREQLAYSDDPRLNKVYNDYRYDIQVTTSSGKIITPIRGDLEVQFDFAS